MFDPLPPAAALPLCKGENGNVPLTKGDGREAVGGRSVLQFLMSERPGIFPRVCSHDVTVADKLILVDQQSVYPNRPACVGFVGADADLSSKTVPKAIGESCGRIPVDACRINLVQEATCVCFVLCNDGIGVCRS